MSTDVVAAIIQGGAVGLAFLMMSISYLLARRGMEMFNTFVSNHMTHLTESIDKNTRVLESLEDALNRRTLT